MALYSASEQILVSLFICGISIIIALRTLRITRLSLGVPFGYLCLLFIEHLPGAFAHLIRPDLFHTTSYVAIGAWQTAIGSLCFVLGLMIARFSQRDHYRKTTIAWSARQRSGFAPLDQKFWLFCLFGGWIVIYGLTALRSIPTLGAIVEKGGGIWMLGVMLGLRDATSRVNIKAVMFWFSALSVYPILVLVFGGFLSFGTIAAVVCISILAISIKNISRVLVGLVILIPISMTVFVNYYIVRAEIRAVAWSNSDLSQRVDNLIDVFSEISFLNLSDNKHADALDERLNQNYFVGIAAHRLDVGLVDFRYGESFYEAAIAPIPRALWPDKPVFGGSGSIVRDMTGLPLSETTSWGVGQVMEFYINFGWLSLVFGFSVLGLLIGRLDMYAAIAERQGDVRRLFVCFLPAVALTQPIVSLVELSGGAFAAYLAAIVWSYVWSYRHGSHRRHFSEGRKRSFLP